MLDCTVLAFKLEPVKDMISFISLKAAAKPIPNMPLNLIHHPKGRRKEIIVQNSIVTNVDGYQVKHTADTERGSSGSPCFNNEWRIVLLHWV
jgi:endonuclease G